MTTANAIIVAGKPFMCSHPVKTWLDTGMHFGPARMRLQTRWVINHWTGAENSAEQTYRGMREHRNALGMPEPLSVHFIVDQLGEIFQCADTEARLAHCKAGGGNTYGVGIEVINRGHSKNPSKGFERSRMNETVHGQLINYGAFFPAQIEAVIALNRSICAAYDLPVRVPLKDGDVYAGVLPDAYREGYRGCLGHFHLERGKVDPAIDILRRIHESGLAG